MTLSSLRMESPCGLKYDDYALWSRGIFPGRAHFERETFIVKCHNEQLLLRSGPESNPAGAVLGRAASPIHPLPTGLPLVELRTPAAQSAPLQRVCVRRGSTSPACFQQEIGTSTQRSQFNRDGFS